MSSEHQLWGDYRANLLARLRSDADEADAYLIFSFVKFYVLRLNFFFCQVLHFTTHLTTMRRIYTSLLFAFFSYPSHLARARRRRLHKAAAAVILSEKSKTRAFARVQSQTGLYVQFRSQSRDYMTVSSIFFAFFSSPSHLANAKLLCQFFLFDGT